MKQEIKLFYKNILNIHNEDILDYLTEHSEMISVKKRTTLFKIGQTIDRMYFFYSGFYYCFVQKSPTRKLIPSLAHRSGLPLIPEPDIKAYDSIHEVFVPVDSTFIVTDFDVINHAIQINQEVYNSYVTLLKDCLEHQVIIQTIRSLPPVERIKMFFDKFNTIAPYMNNTEIAAFLDMSRSEYVKTLKLVDVKES